MVMKIKKCRVFSKCQEYYIGRGVIVDITRKMNTIILFVKSISRCQNYENEPISVKYNSRISTNTALILSASTTIQYR